MKKYVILTVCFAFLLGCMGCQKKENVDFFAKEVISTGGLRMETSRTLSGVSNDRAVILSEESYDENLIEGTFAGLFDDTDNEVLYAKNSTEKMYPASITKCMTALLVLENVSDLSEMVLVGPEMYEGLTANSSSAGLQMDDQVSVKDLLSGLIVPSGNDAANVLANYVSGSIPDFVDLMNKRAKELGMLNTHFMNPHGLHHDNHYTTVYDLYLLMHECLKYDFFKDIAGAETKDVIIIHGNGEKEDRTYKSGNSFLRNYTQVPTGFYITAAKTGYTEKAGRCLLFAVTGKDHHVYISVVGHAKDYDSLYEETNIVLSQVEFTE